MTEDSLARRQLASSRASSPTHHIPPTVASKIARGALQFLYVLRPAPVHPQQHPRGNVNALRIAPQFMLLRMPESRMH